MSPGLVSDCSIWKCPTTREGHGTALVKYFYPFHQWSKWYPTRYKALFKPAAKLNSLWSKATVGAFLIHRSDVEWLHSYWKLKCAESFIIHYTVPRPRSAAGLTSKQPDSPLPLPPEDSPLGCPWICHEHGFAGRTSPQTFQGYTKACHVCICRAVCGSRSQPWSAC